MGRAAAAAAPPRPAPRRHTPRPSAPRRRSGNKRNAPQPAEPAASRTARTARAHAQPLPLPVRIWEAPFARTARARTGRLLDVLLSGRGWIALVFLLLAGIVFFNVDLLQMNREIARNSEKISSLKRENARLLLDQARLANSERIQEEAMKLGLVLPAPGEVRYLKARPSEDARRAAKSITVSTDGYAREDEADTGGETSESASGIDPVTGFPVDPETGAPVYDPVTGAPLDPTTGEPLDLSGTGTSTATPDTTAGTPTDGTATGATGTTGATTDPAAQPVG